MCVYLSINVYIYIYIDIHIDREEPELRPRHAVDVLRVGRASVVDAEHGLF